MNKDEIDAMQGMFMNFLKMSNPNIVNQDIEPEAIKTIMDRISTNRNFCEKETEKIYGVTRKMNQVNEANAKHVSGETKRLGGLITGLRNMIDAKTSLDKEYFDNQLNKLRLDYRSLQNEMWERFDVLENWILATNSSDKDKCKKEIISIREDHKRQQNYTMLKKDDNKLLGGNLYVNAAQLSKSLVDIEHLSLRSKNGLINANIKTVGQLIQRCPSELLKVKNFGRKCLHEVVTSLKVMDLTLDMKKEADIREKRRQRIEEQFKL